VTKKRPDKTPSAVRTKRADETQIFRDYEELFVKMSEGAAKSLREFQDAHPDATEEAPPPSAIEEAESEWRQVIMEDGRWVRDIVVNAATLAIARLGADTATGRAIQTRLDRFVASFDTFAAGGNRKAAFEAMKHEAFIFAFASDDPSFVTRLRNDQAALARRALESQLGQPEAAMKRAAITCAVRQAMSESKVKVKKSGGIGYARSIQPEVQKLLDLQFKDGKDRFQISDWRVRDEVRENLKKPTLGDS
jgi:hypothetical protein